uniref:EamA domain-containing protein n=1 Tax=Chromera velia CCMP2878 TaxID=1169474 RepID=A0A0G4HQQ2_9ALVE|eukprot:Cvel_7947.t1-p1 / transcript=Cvel_7947.t1 / gene=Cvel_7947 / organism=Chromera_velia_CCMP2878 / gene_product=Thiamine-repressible mitochondrial transport, putative / transcript_product=Thiamine-repressible mitochondrial transport, putative / location=Cvel_scaffold427:25398-27868(+) / protein_length=411 / sequence_SO=supercontig / SO=protein_coding / is_pseudo=false
MQAEKASGGFLAITAKYLAVLACITTWLLMTKFGSALSQSEINLGLFRICASVVYGVLFFSLWIVWRFVSKKRGSEDDLSLCNAEYLGGKSWGTLAFWALICGTIWQIGVYIWYISLSMTSISGNTAVFQSAPAFVYLFSVIFLGEKFSPVKTAGVIVSQVGVLMVTLYGTTDEGRARGESPLGYVLVTLSVIGYAAIQTIRVKYTISASDDVPIANALRFTCLYGAMPLPVVALLVFVANWTGLEAFKLPGSGIEVLQIFLNCSIDASFRLSLFAGLVACSPVFLNVGNLLTVPASCLLDYVSDGFILPFNALAGIGLIAAGFFLVAVLENVKGGGGEEDEEGVQRLSAEVGRLAEGDEEGGPTSTTGAGRDVERGGGGVMNDQEPETETTDDNDDPAMRSLMTGQRVYR